MDKKEAQCGYLLVDMIKVFKLAKVVAVDELVVYLVETNNENSERQSHGRSRCKRRRCCGRL